ncbi:yrdC domain-containing protein, mitochondrial-like [Schistocerca americana]|uniref:yrdC domain-containing protein, mitochondrial-like n=1 Tax=Schistocerca americana TaxID=7009 RepID=UPI001F4F5AE4|nr:yrdC domain-containing protein, mitochondrial-like [Schistocerca americana]
MSMPKAMIKITVFGTTICLRHCNSKIHYETVELLRKMALQSINSDYKALGNVRKSFVDNGLYNSVTINHKKLEAYAEQAVRLLMQDCVIAVPTDTVYGLAGAVQSEDAVEKLYKIKGRDAAKPIAICVSSISEVEKWADTSILPPALLQCILPGPFTIVLKRSKALNAKFNPGIPNVGIRIPQDRFIVEVVKKFGEPIALTSANSSGEQSAIEVEEFSHLWQYVDAVFDAGKIPQEIRTGSTVVDLSEHGSFKIIRAGVSCDALRHKLFQFKLLERN